MAASSTRGGASRIVLSSFYEFTPSTNQVKVGDGDGAFSFPICLAHSSCFSHVCPFSVLTLSFHSFRVYTCFGQLDTFEPMNIGGLYDETHAEPPPSKSIPPDLTLPSYTILEVRNPPKPSTESNYVHNAHPMARHRSQLSRSVMEPHSVCVHGRFSGWSIAYPFLIDRFNRAKYEPHCKIGG